MYICSDCGKIYENDEVEHIEKVEYGYLHCGLGVPLNDNLIIVDDCETCGGEVVKAKKCEKCGEWCANDKPFCLDCLEKHKTLDTMLEIGGDYEEKILLNGFLASVFTKEDIELILIDALKNGEKETLDKAINKYCDEDMEYFWGVAEKKCREDK